MIIVDPTAPHVTITGPSYCWAWDYGAGEDGSVRWTELGVMLCGQTHRWRTLSWFGTGWDWTLHAPAAMAQLAALPRADRTNIAVMCGGAGDIARTDYYPGGGLTGAEGYGRACEMAAALRAMGYQRIIGVDIFPVLNELLEDPSGGEWVTLRDLYRADPDGAFDAFARHGLEDNTDMDHYAIDLMHLRAAGARRLADTIRPHLL